MIRDHYLGWKREIEEDHGSGVHQVEFDELFNELYPSLQRYCFRMTGDPDQADDVAQEAFVRLLRRAAAAEPEKVKAWLFTTALNLIRDRSRVATNRRRLLEENPGNPSRPNASGLPDADLERRERIDHVRAILDELPERDRSLLIMREEGFAYREMAAIVGVAPGSVGTLLARAEARFVKAHERKRETHDASNER